MKGFFDYRGIPPAKCLIMGKFDGYLILTDIDGTLTDSHQRISEENSQAVRHFQDEGGLFTVATGRFPDYIENYRDSFIPNTYIIALNGTVVYDPETKKDIIARHLEEDFGSIVKEIIASNPEIEDVYINPRVGSCDLRTPDFGSIDEFLSTAPKPWFKVIFSQGLYETQIVKARLKEKYGHRYTINCSWPYGIEFYEKSCGKGEMLEEIKALLKLRGVDVKTSVCVGDFENDISMIEAADIGYAMGNAEADVKAAADRITVTNDESAIAHIIAELEAEIQ